MQGSLVRILSENLLFFHAEILGRLGSNLVFIVPFGTSYVEFGTEVWLGVSEVFKKNKKGGVIIPDDNIT